MRSHLRAAVIGCGRMGFQFDASPIRGAPVETHLGAYALHPDVEIVAVCDADAERRAAAARRYRVPHHYADYRSLFQKTKFDIVSICLPPEAHADAVIAAAESGVRAIFCEKPIAVSLAESDAMIDACERRGVLLAVNHSRRWEPRFSAVGPLLASGVIGNPVLAHAFAPVGFLNSGTHLFDLLRQYFGDVVRVTGELFPDPSTDPGGWGVLQFQSGLRCTVDSRWREYLLFGVDVYGSTGVLRVGGTIHAERVVELLRPAADALNSSTSPLTVVPWVAPSHTAPILGAVENIVSSVRGTEHLRCTGRDGRAALELAIAMHVAATQRSVVTLPLTNRALRVLPRATSHTKSGAVT